MNMVGIRRVLLLCLLAATALGGWPGSPIDFTNTLHAAQQRRPIAVAGLNQAVAGIGTLVQLDGSASSDPAGSALAYQWTFVEMPAGSAAVLSAATTSRPTFVPDVKGRYRAQLVVSTAAATSRADVVVITVRNTAPAADAGDAVFAAVGDLVRLDGSRSSDVDGDPLTFQWSFMSRPRGSRHRFADATAIQPTFLVDKPGRYVARLVVHDGQARGADTVIVDVPNTPPAANAGPDRTATVGERVRLDGSGSADSDGDRLAYEWALVTIPAGSAATLRNPASVRPRFVVDRPGRYEAQLIVHDGLVASPPDTIVINTGNSAPVANAGADVSALLGQTVQLIGSGSSDIDGDELTYQWTLLGGPEGSTATIADASTVNPSLQVDRRGSYTVQLIVHDGIEASSPDLVVVTVGNSAPVANAGSDRRVTVGESITLDGSGSTDVDGDPLLYQWSLTLVPLGSTATLDEPNAVRPTFDVDLPGEYLAQLLVSDGTSFSAADTVAIDTENVAPIAGAGPDQSAYVGQFVVLTGADSRDADGTPVTFAWSFALRPAGSAAELTGTTTIGPGFTVDVPGDYVVQLIVSDGELTSVPDTVTVTTRANTLPVANAGADIEDVAVGSEVVLNASASSDTDGHPLVYRWSLLARPVGSAAALSDPEAVFPAFTADVAGDYVAQLIVGDGLNESAPDTVLVRTLRPTVVANAGPDQAVETGTSVQLDGSGSSASSGQSLTYQWSFASVPSGSQAVLSSTTAVDPTFVADVAGTYELQLTVTTASGATATDSVTIAAVALQPSVVSVSASDSSAEEAGANDGAFTITRSAPYSGALTVNLAIGGTATAGTDYTSVPLAVQIPDGEVSLDIPIAALPDVEIEGDEFVVLTLQSGGYTIGAPDSATVIITDSTLEGGSLINGANHRGSIRPSGDSDAWTFDANSGDAIFLSLAEVGTNTELVPRLDLLAPNGTLVSWSWGNVTAQVHVQAPQTGTYTVVVASYDSGLDGTGDYRLTLARTPAAFVVPPDDEGGGMTNGANHAGRIHVGDLDQWTFAAAQGDAIFLSLAEASTNTDFVPLIHLRGPNGALVDWSWGNVTAQVQVQAPQTGTYTVVVSTYDSGLDASGEYRLTLAHTPGTFTVPTGDEGGAMTSGANHPGRIHVGDLDQWSFTAVQGDAIFLSLAEVGTNTDYVPLIHLRAPNGALVNWSWGNVTAQVHVQAPQTGTYTVVVSTYDSGLDASGEYRLTLAHTPGTFTVPTGDEGGAMINGANHQGRIHVGDLDQWSFTAVQGDAIFLSLAEVGTNPDFVPLIHLRAPNGALVTWSWGNVTAQVHVQAPQTGTYTVVVSTYDSGLDAADR